MNKYIIPNLLNACRVLKFMAEEDIGMTTNEIARRLEVPRTTMLRILSTLNEEGLVCRKGRNYHLGNVLIHLGAKTMEKIDLRNISIPVLKQLSLETQETAHLAILANSGSLLLEVCDSPNPVRVASRAGTLADIHCSATGKVFIAFKIEDLDDFFRDKDLKKRTDNTLTTLDALKRDSEKSRSRGYSIDEEEYNMGVRCLAAPIRDAFGEVAAAIGITASTTTFTKKRISEVSQQVVSAAQKISSVLGERRQED